MIELFVYPVSAVMKAWHIVLHSLLGVEAHTAWIISIVGLIITIRSIIVPFAWIQYRNGRYLVNLRPKLYALQEEYSTRIDHEAPSEMQQKRKALMRDHNYSMKAGLGPALIQIPFFFGLYRVLLWMAVPQDGLETSNHKSIGLLTGHDVNEFVETRFLGVPLVAYVKMPEETLNWLGVTRDTVLHLNLPFFIIAALLTGLNMLNVVRRNNLTLEWQQDPSVKVNKFFLFTAIITPLMPIYLCMTAPAPTAIALYWAVNSSWTSVQYFLINKALDHFHPLTEEFNSFQKQALADYKVRAKLQTRRRWLRRGRYLVLWRWKAWTARAAELKEEINREKNETKTLNRYVQAKRKADKKAAEEIKKMEEAAPAGKHRAAEN